MRNEECNKIKTSVALCTYNGERFLRRQLESFAAQTVLPDEVVVGDDGSSDETLEMLARWAAEVPFPVRVMRNEKNLGYAKNFESVMGRCAGDVIFLSDQDDAWHPQRIARTLAVFESRPEVGVVFCNARVVGEHDEPLGMDLVTYTRPWFRCREPGWLFPEAAAGEEIAIFGCATAARRTLLERLLPMDANWGHDVWIYGFTRYFAELAVIAEPLFDYRLHGKNVSMKLGAEAYTEWRNSYFRDAVYLSRLYAQKRADIRRRLAALPDSPRKTRHLAFLASQEKHLARRVKIQQNPLRYAPLWMWEILTGGYFRHQQPVKSMLFDVKEGMTQRKK